MTLLGLIARRGLRTSTMYRFEWMEKPIVARSETEIAARAEHNFTQIFRQPVSSLKPEDKKWAKRELLRSLELAMLLGQRREKPDERPNHTMMGGVAFYSPQVRHPLTSPLDPYLIQEGMRWGLSGTTAYGTNHKYLVAAGDVLRDIRLPQTGDWFTKQGHLTIIRCRALEFTTGPRYAFIIDPAHLKLVKHQHRGLKLIHKWDQPEYLADMSVEVGFPEAHLVLSDREPRH